MTNDGHPTAAELTAVEHFILEKHYRNLFAELIETAALVMDKTPAEAAAWVAGIAAGKAAGTE